MPITVITGGLPAIARNNGVKQSKYDLLLFIDSDVTFYSKNLIYDSIKLLKTKELDLVTTYLNSNILKTKIIYFLSNIASWCSQFTKPFATTQYFLIKKNIFLKLGGFNEEFKHCEDYLLSKKINRKKFKIINYYTYSDDRRFKKTGYFNFFIYFIKNMINSNNEEYFKKNINYW